MRIFFMTGLLFIAYYTQIIQATDQLLLYDVTQITETNIVKNNTCTSTLITECPRKRLKPSFQVLNQSISFDKRICQQEWSHTCRKDAFQRRCHRDTQDPLTGSNLEAITLSILFHYECQHKTWMQVLQWSNMVLTINCDSWSIELKIGNSCFSSKFENMQDYIHILSQMAWHNDTFESSNVYFNGSNDDKEPVCVESKMPPETPKRIHIGGNQNKDSIIDDHTFIGRILFMDIFNHNLNISQREMEFQYGQQKAAQKAYPECLCPTTQPCQDASRLVGNAQSKTYFSPLRAIKDGLLNPKGNFGYWLSSRKGELTIQLDLHHPSLVQRIEIFTFNQTIKVKKGQRSGTFTTLFEAKTKQNQGDQVMMAKSYKWEDPDKDGLQALVWSPPHTKKLFVQSLQISFTYTQGIDYTLVTNDCLLREHNPIYEVKVYGRYFDPHKSSDMCACFPGNGQKDDGCDKCNMCICRNGYSKYADSYCSPYINDILPSYGPASGGTVVTMTGGLLIPKLGTENITLSIENMGNCFIKNDTNVICKMRKMNSTNTNHSLPVGIKVKFLLGDVTYDLKTSFQYTYRPDPVVTDIKPYKSFVFGGSKITIKGKNLNSLDMGDGRKALLIQNKYGECKNVDNSTIVCLTPPVGHEGSSNASIRLLFDDVDTSQDLRKLGVFQIYPNPIFNEDVEIRNGGVTLHGQDFDTCCNMSEYNISIGGVPCNVVYLTSTLMKCHPRSTSWNALYGKVIKVQLHGMKYDVGYIPPGQNGVLIGLCIALGAVIIIATLSTGIYIWKKKKHERLSREDSHAHILLDHQKSNDMRELQRKDQLTSIETLDDDLKTLIQNNILDFVDLHILGQIKRGTYGKVLNGHLTLIEEEYQVTLKTLIGGWRAQTEKLKEFLEEATMMKGFHHPNVLSLMGTIIDGDDIFVVLPCMENGDLLNHVQQKVFDFKIFAGFGLDIANGMDYLSSQGFIHRDLAARNCLVDLSGKVLVGDSSLSRDVYEKDYFLPGSKQKPLPFKWMALESLTHKAFSIKSDVWSLGITLWEIFSRGAKPYPNVKFYDVKSYLEHGYRLEKPQTCSDALYNIMRLCWFEDPAARPGFPEIATALNQLKEGDGERVTLGGFQAQMAAAYPCTLLESFQSITLLSEGQESLDSTESASSCQTMTSHIASLK